MKYTSNGVVAPTHTINPFDEEAFTDNEPAKPKTILIAEVLDVNPPKTESGGPEEKAEREKESSRSHNYNLKNKIGRRNCLYHLFKLCDQGRLSHYLRESFGFPIEDYLDAANDEGTTRKLIEMASDLVESFKAPTSKPEITLPHLGKNDSEFAEEICKHMPENTLFRKDGFIVEVLEREPDEEDGETKGNGRVQISTMSKVRFTTWVEQFITRGRKVEVDGDLGKEIQFLAQTMSDAQSGRLLEGKTLQKGLPAIKRILDVCIPILYRNQIVYPQPGYNKGGIFLDPLAPKVSEMPIEDAKAIIHKIHKDFCLKDDQDRTHAIARFLTPYLRGVMGFSYRVPCWFYEGNRPGCGKDYLAGATQVTYQGAAFEDAAIGSGAFGTGPEETRKRITSYLVSGRRMVHFANCQQHIEDEYLIQAITASTFNARMLGGTSSKSDLHLPNEIDYSISANIGLTFREDMERRIRRISMAYYDEDENSRTYETPYLHEWIQENRSLVLSGVHTLFKTWWDAGHPKCDTPFTSFKKWAEVVGGVMLFHGYGNPCLPHKAPSAIGGDLQKSAMTALFELAFEESKGCDDKWFTKAQIFQLIKDNQDNDDPLQWFGDMGDRNHKTKSGLAIKKYSGRTLSEISMVMDTSPKKSEQHKILFTKPSVAS
jgi:hypothetical protein